MDMQHYARMKEDQLSTEIIGLDERIAEFTEPENPDSRCVASYLKQLLKSKRSKLALGPADRGVEHRRVNQPRLSCANSTLPVLEMHN